MDEWAKQAGDLARGAFSDQGASPTGDQLDRLRDDAQSIYEQETGQELDEQETSEFSQLFYGTPADGDEHDR